MRLLIVIVCYKVVDLTISCLHSLSREVALLPGVKVAVCENGTGGDAFERLERVINENGWGSWVELTSVMPNRGFTGGNNHLLEPAMQAEDKPEYLLLLNADTEIYAGALHELLKFMDEHPRVGIAGSQLLWPDGGIGPSPFQFEGIVSQLNHGLRLGIVRKLLRRWIDAPDKSRTGPVDWVSGACMIIRREVMEKIGTLDEGYFTYFDDIDYCLNARRAGYEVWYVTTSKVMHLEGASTQVKYSSDDKPLPRRAGYWFDARRRFFLKNYGAIYAALCDAAFITGLALWGIRRRIQRKRDEFPQSFLTDAIRHSVFLNGFKIPEVENPAMPKTSVQPRLANGAI
ncbi:MAG TPA: glycosyltransferase family 2 protein [Tepidisphaeraceae bacterium]